MSPGPLTSGTSLQIRPETADDQRAIHNLTANAFASMTFSDGTEADCIDRLRADGDLLLSLVAENFETGDIIGHCAFSHAIVSAAQGNWIGLGPISVRVDQRRRGIGRQLVETGLKHLQLQGAAGCVLIGNPDIYTRLGFASNGYLEYRDLTPDLIMYRVLNGVAPRGRITFAPGLEGTAA